MGKTNPNLAPLYIPTEQLPAFQAITDRPGWVRWAIKNCPPEFKKRIKKLGE